MGQLLSRPPEPTGVRNGRRRSQSQRNQLKKGNTSEGLRNSRARERSPVQYHIPNYQRGLATSSDEAETYHPGPRLRPKKNIKGNPRPRSKRYDSSETRPPSTRRTASNGPRPPRHRSRQGEPLPPIPKHVSQRRDSHSSPRHERPRQQRQRETKDCIICADTRSLRRFPNRPPTTQCQHDVDVCRRCLRTWIQTEFATKIWDEMNCPVCSIRLQHEDVREFAPSDVFRRYDKLSTRAALEAIPGFTWCIAKGCKSGHVHTAPTNKFTCVACRKSHCIQHNVVWHKRETCREYDYRTNKNIKKAEELASKNLILQTTKKCPGCKRSIEKSFGCDHMTCSRCKHEFCWQCLASYAKKHRGHVVHRADCVYHDPDLILI